MKLNSTHAICTLALISTIALGSSWPLIIDHNHVDITALSETDIHRAKAVLHIAYGHTSHGSQVTDGMSSLVGFANGGGKGLSLPTDIFGWNDGGTGGALDLHDYAMGGDAGYYPQWYNNTINYLDNPANSDVNVIIWSWCGQMDNEYASGTLSNYYLLPMASLETSYPDVVFVYMTGHVPDINQMSPALDNNTKAACQAIRDFCTANNSVLYDFNDIEHYSPDGTYFPFVTDNCDYYTTNSGSSSGNWATEWRAAHTEDVDWYSCGAAHSDALNANQKAYAAWALWCELGKDFDRDGIADVWEERHGNTDMFKGGTNDCDGDGATDFEEYIADTVPTNMNSSLRLDGIRAGETCTLTFPCSTSRVYSLEYITDPCSAQWAGVIGAMDMSGTASGTMSLTDTNNNDACRLYRIGVERP